MIVETDNLRRISTIAASYQGQKKKQIGVTRVYMVDLFKKYNVEPIVIDNEYFYDIKTLPSEIMQNIKF